MMTQPAEQQPPAGEASNADQRYREASQEPRGDWGNVAFEIVDDTDSEEPDDAGR